MLQIKHFIYTISPMVWVKFNNPIIRERLVVKSPLFRLDIQIAATGYSHSMLQQIRTAVFISCVIKLNFIPSFLPYHNYDIFIRCKCSVISREDSFLVKIYANHCSFGYEFFDHHVYIYSGSNISSLHFTLRIQLR